MISLSVPHTPSEVRGLVAGHGWGALKPHAMSLNAPSAGRMDQDKTL